MAAHSTFPQRQSSYIALEDYVRRAYHASAIAGGYLYIDGGEEIVIVDGRPVSRILNKTLSIDLSSSWTNQSVEIVAIEKPSDCPNMNWGDLWLNPRDNALYSFGGEFSEIDPLIPVVPTSAWKMQPDGSGRGKWTVATSPDNTSFTPGLTRPVGAFMATSPKASYYIGGWSSIRSSPECSNFAWYQCMPLPGVVSFDFESNTWSNTSSSGYSAAGTAEYGEMHYIPCLGSSGAFVLIGGDTSSAERYIFAKTPRTFDNITVYEPESQTWYHQTATGDIPSPRIRFCIVGLSGGDNSTYEIFMYGGWDNVPGNVTIRLDQIYVLSLPAFRWFKADYFPNMARHSHTCHIVGNRQLISIGGSDPEQVVLAYQKPDQFLQGLAVFDLSEMAWSESYNANAAPYTRPRVVTAYYEDKGNQPSAWDQPELKQLFSSFPSSSAPQSSSQTTSHLQPSSSTISTNSFFENPSSHPNHALRPGSIVGIVLGILSVLVIIAFSFNRIIHRNSHIKRSKETINANKRLPLVHPSEPEIDGNPRCEMDEACFRPELATSTARQELVNDQCLWPFELAAYPAQELEGAMVYRTCHTPEIIDL